MANASAFAPVTPTYAITVGTTTTTAVQILPTSGVATSPQQMRIYNSGNSPVCVRFTLDQPGGGAITFPTDGNPQGGTVIPPGGVEVLTYGGKNWVQAIATGPNNIIYIRGGEGV